MPQFYYNVGSVDRFYEEVEKLQEGYDDPVYPETEIRHDWGGEILGWILPIALIIGVWFFFMRMMGHLHYILTLTQEVALSTLFYFL